MSTHNICISQEIRKILCGYPLLSVAMIRVCLFVVFFLFFYVCFFDNKVLILVFLYENVINTCFPFYSNEKHLDGQMVRAPDSSRKHAYIILSPLNPTFKW